MEDVLGLVLFLAILLSPAIVASFRQKHADKEEME